MSEINLRYIKSIWKYLIKRMTEYKVNFYSSIIVEISYIIIFMVLFFILKNNFKDISWTTNDFILFLVLYSLMYELSFMFISKFSSFYFSIKKGYLNESLILPKNTLLILLTKDLSYTSFVSTIIEIFFLTILLILKIVIIKNLFIFISLFFILIIFYIFSFIFISSFELRFIGISKNHGNFIYNLESFIERFPGIFFKNFKYKFILYISLAFLVSIFLIPIAKNEITKELIETIIIFIFITVILVILAIINWNHNLKYYEAYS